MPELNLDKVSKITLYTNRSSSFFDENGEQLAELQSIFDCYGENKNEEWDILEQLYEYRHAIEFYLADWGNWIHRISFEQYCFMLGHGKQLERLQIEDRVYAYYEGIA